MLANPWMKPGYRSSSTSRPWSASSCANASPSSRRGSNPAVATNAGQLKVGSFTRGERMAKWNEVLRIERELGARARFVGADHFAQAGIKLPVRDHRG